MRRARHWIGARLVHLALLTLAAGAAAIVPPPPLPALHAADRPADLEAQRGELAAVENACIEVADTIEPTVVTIDAVQVPRPTPHRRAKLPDLRPLLRGPLATLLHRAPRGAEEAEVEEAERSGGSGIIVREIGGYVYVLTNQHVIEGADRIHVRLHTRRDYRASVVGADAVADLAVLRFRPEQPLGPEFVARLGDSDRVRVGQFALAVGSPLGYDFTLTKGVISAKGRELDGVEGETDYRGLLQTDASINPGNSGGPLVNIDGEVIGVNVAIASPTGTSVGLGFAIPSNTAKRVMAELIAHGKVTRGYLGVSTSPENEELSSELQRFYGADRGALIENVSPNTPAARCGLLSEDVVVAFDDHPIRSYGDLIEAVQNTPPGKQVTLHVMRDRKPITLRVTLSDRADQEAAGAGEEELPSEAPAKPAARNGYGIAVVPGEDGDVVIRAVAPGTAAEDAGLCAGDVIVRCGRRPIHSLADWRQALDAASHGAALVLRVHKADTDSAAVVVVQPD